MRAENTDCGSPSTASEDGGSAWREVRWSSVLTFYFLACTFSWPFFWWRDQATDSWQAWRVPGFLKTATYMWGPGVAALVVLWIWKGIHPRRITLLGTSPRRSLVLWIAPLLLLATIGIGGPGEQRMRAIFALLPLIGLFTILGEEVGWRGFLQDALHPLPWWIRYTIIGVLWAAWHFTNGFQHGSLANAALAYPMSILLSVLIGIATERSRSILVACSLHAWVDLAFEFAAPETWIVIACAVGLAIWLLWTWPAPPSVAHVRRCPADAER